MDEACDSNRRCEAETGVDSILSSAEVDRDDDCSCRTDGTTIPASNVTRRITISSALKMDAPEPQNDSKVPPNRWNNETQFREVLTSFFAAIRQNSEDEKERKRNMIALVSLLCAESTFGGFSEKRLEADLVRAGIPRDALPSTPEERRAFISDFEDNPDAVHRCLTIIGDQMQQTLRNRGQQEPTQMPPAATRHLYVYAFTHLMGQPPPLAAAPNVLAALPPAPAVATEGTNNDGLLKTSGTKIYDKVSGEHETVGPRGKKREQGDGDSKGEIAPHKKTKA